MTELLKPFRKLMFHYFNLQEDKADEADIILSIRKNVEFRGANLWALIFAIVIASIGLNVNSTAVIIGAMLISPIMGPVMGIGLGIGINDLTLVKKGAKNLLVATIISILTSTAYFAVTPLHEAQSELLARTSPSIWDVFIAFSGGLAGMVAASRKEKNNVIPGVAIATALMPPLCTVGFGIATANWYFVFGALYLYFINSIFIAIATYLISRYLRLHKKYFEDLEIKKKVTRYMIIIVVVTILPSIWMAYRIVNKSIFETNARRFVEEQFKFKNAQVISKSFNYGASVNTIDLLLIGVELDQQTIKKLTDSMANYQLSGTKLQIHQGLNARQQLDFSQIKASILEDVFNNQTLSRLSDSVSARDNPIDSLVLVEIRALYPAIKSYSLSDITTYSTNATRDTQKVAIAAFMKPLRQSDVTKLQRWLQTRYQNKTLKLIAQ